MINTPKVSNLQTFINKAKKCKSTFTNDPKTQKLLQALILKRYKDYSRADLIYDVPRMRIIPNSEFLSAGISYNYLPHRDTWYGAGQDQINHWMALANVTEDATFYVSPSYFSQPFANNSEIFDLDRWDEKYRPLAEANTKIEERPHPVPLGSLKEDDRCRIIIPPGYEFVFSGQHLHGSGKNITDHVRFSIDYRVCVNTQSCPVPLNVDNRATGNYKKYMLPV